MIIIGAPRQTVFTETTSPPYHNWAIHKLHHTPVVCILLASPTNPSRTDALSSHSGDTSEHWEDQEKQRRSCHSLALGRKMMKGGKMKRGQEKDGKHTCVRLGSKKQKKGEGRLKRRVRIGERQHRERQRRGEDIFHVISVDVPLHVSTVLLLLLPLLSDDDDVSPQSHCSSSRHTLRGIWNHPTWQNRSGKKDETRLCSPHGLLPHGKHVMARHREDEDASSSSHTRWQRGRRRAWLMCFH